MKMLPIVLVVAVNAPAGAQPTQSSQVKAPPRVIRLFKDDRRQALYEKRIKGVSAGPYISKAQRALPTQKNLPGFELSFKGVHIEPYSSKAQQALPTQNHRLGTGLGLNLENESSYSVLTATRQSDKAVLEITVLSTPNPDAIEGWLFNREIVSFMAPPPKGTPSGKPLGEQAWQTRPAANKNEKSSSFELRVQDGPSLVLMQMTARINRDADGWGKWGELAPQDRLFVEQIARGIVWRLHTLGLTHDSYKKP